MSGGKVEKWSGGKVEKWSGEMAEKWSGAVVAATRVVIGWHLAYLGIWAITSTWSYSWFGLFQCAHWFGSGFFRAIAGSDAISAVDFVFAWGLLLAGALLMLGRLVKPAAVFGIVYLLVIYILNPPHFGHTGESHFLFIDRNLIEVAMLFVVMACSGGKVEKCSGGKVEKCSGRNVEKEVAK